MGTSASPGTVATADVLSPADVTRLVQRFYAAAIPDRLLGPVFRAFGVDWSTHVPLLVTFWERELLGHPGDAGNVLRAHAEVLATAFGEAHLQRWLELFGETVDELFAGPVADHAKRRAEQIARSIGVLTRRRASPPARPLPPPVPMEDPMPATAPPPPVDTRRTLGDLVAERPARARVLEAAGLDYCCHGRRPLAEAAAAAGVDAETLAADLAAVEETPDGEVDRLGPVALTGHIVATHHAYLHDELPALEALAAKVDSVHGAHHPELARVARLVAAVRAELEPHLAEEEAVLFPAVRALVDGTGDAPRQALAASLPAMLGEHEQAGDLLAELRRTTVDYAVPADGCASYRSLYERLAALEADTFRHVHLENNVLTPAVTALLDDGDAGREPGHV